MMRAVTNPVKTPPNTSTGVCPTLSRRACSSGVILLSRLACSPTFILRLVASRATMNDRAIATPKAGELTPSFIAINYAMLVTIEV